jgi:nucleoside-diphosphate-sugar epimerase
MKAHKEETGETPILLHTSGTGVLVVDARGKAPKSSDPIYDDSDVNQLRNIPDDAPHREGDLAILKADKEGYLKAYFIFPSTIYGEAPTGDLGKGEWKGKLANRRSIQMPAAIRLAFKRGNPGVYGKGENVWPHVHIEDLMHLYNAVFELAKDGKGDHGENGYYFAENGQ